MIAIVDYGVGNLFSLKSSLQAVGAEAIVTGQAADLRTADRIILPGVGAFGDAIKKLHESGLAETVKNEAANGKPLLGICLGMQMLLEKSYEYGEHEGLGLIPGTIRPIAQAIPQGYKIPHIGWNALSFPAEKHPIFADLQEGDHVYFVHSFHGVDCEQHTAATTEYGGILTAAVAKGNVVGCQFHPEKSGPVGLKLLNAFCNKEIF